MGKAKQQEVWEALNTDLAGIPGGALLVPADEEFVPWHTSSGAKRRGKVGGGSATLGSSLALGSWLAVTGAPALTATTLVPMGVLVLLYNQYVLKRGGGGGAGSIAENFDAHPLVSRHQTLTGGKAPVTPESWVPFGMLLGKDIAKTALTAVGKYKV